jgi:hypothetical protein
VACAFLQETAIHSASSQPQSRPTTPGPKGDHLQDVKHPPAQLQLDNPISISDNRQTIQDREQKQAAKHTLLASAANQNYQRCYRALKSLETYWAGIKYILTVLDQKAKGVGDPLLYTAEEMESALEAPRPEPSFTSPGWRRKLSWGTYLAPENADGDVSNMPAAIRKGVRTPIMPGSPAAHPSQGMSYPLEKILSANSPAIGWSLTGNMNSPSTNVAVMYTAENNREVKHAPSKQSPTDTRPSIASLMSQPAVKFEPPMPSAYPPFNPASMPPPPGDAFGTASAPDPALVSDADLLLNLHSPFSGASPATNHSLQSPTSYLRAAPIQAQNAQMQGAPSTEFSPTYTAYPTSADTLFGDMVIDTQDVDMSVLGADMMPWDLEYLPHDLLYFGDGVENGGPEG